MVSAAPDGAAAGVVIGAGWQLDGAALETALLAVAVGVPVGVAVGAILRRLFLAHIAAVVTRDRQIGEDSRVWVSVASGRGRWS